MKVSSPRVTTNAAVASELVHLKAKRCRASPSALRKASCHVVCLDEHTDMSRKLAMLVHRLEWTGCTAIKKEVYTCFNWRWL